MPGEVSQGSIAESQRNRETGPARCCPDIALRLFRKAVVDILITKIIAPLSSEKDSGELQLLTRSARNSANQFGEPSIFAQGRQIRITLEPGFVFITQLD